MDLRDLQNVDLSKLKPGQPVVAEAAEPSVQPDQSAEPSGPMADSTAQTPDPTRPPSPEEIAQNTSPSPGEAPKPNAPQFQTKMRKGLNWRLATSLRDLEITREISEEFHGRSHYAHIPFSHKKRDDFIAPALERGADKALIICEYSETGDPANARVMGASFCGVGEYMFGFDYLICTVYAFYVREDMKSLLRGKAAIGLLRSIKAWAKAKNAGEVMVHVTADTIQHDRFWRKVGAKVLGGNYVV